MVYKNIVGLHLGRAIMARKNLVGLYLGRPIMARKILWAFSWADPLWSAKSCGPLVGPAHLNFVGHFWPGPRVGPSANENFTRGKSALVVAVNGLSDPKSDR